MPSTASPPTDPVAAELRELRLAVHRLAAVVNSRLAPPVDLLTVKEAAARVKKCPKTIRKWIALGILTERRAGTGKGAEHRILADELDVLLADGEDACRRYRVSMGRA